MSRTSMMAGLATVAILAAGSLQTATAQEPTCNCYASISGGVLSAPTGDVVISQQTGLRPAANGAELAPGARVMVGPRSGAQVSFAGCDLALAANSQLDVIAQNERLCLQVTDGSGPQTTAQLGETGTGAGLAGLGGATLPVALFGTVTLGAIGVAVATEGDTAVSD